MRHVQYVLWYYGISSYPSVVWVLSLIRSIRIYSILSAYCPVMALLQMVSQHTPDVNHRTDDLTI